MTTLLEKINSHETKGSISDLVSPASNTYDFSNKRDVIFINTGDVHEGKFLHTNRIEIKKLPGQAKKIIERGDIVFSEIRPKNRHFAIVDFDARDYVVSTKLIVLKVKKDVDPSFAYIVLTADKNLREFQNIAESRSGTFPQITFDSIADFEIRLPDFLTQKQIAEVFGTYDVKIANNNFIIERLEKLAQATFEEWFFKYRFPGNEDIKLVKSDVGESPEDWRVDSLSEICDVNPHTPTLSKTPLHADMKDLSETGMYFSVSERKELSSGSRFKNHDTLLARITPCLENGKTGYVSFLQDNEVASGSTEFLVIRSKTEDYREYIYLLARNSRFRNFAIGHMVGSSGRQRVSGGDIGRFKFAFPPDGIIKKFHNILEPVFRSITTMSEENKRLSLLRDQLLRKLI